MAEDDYKLEQELTSFRQKWHEEIQGKQDDTTDVASSNHGENESKNSASNGLPNISTSSSVNEREVPDATVKEETEKEQKAAKLFLRGVQLEGQKFMYDAIQFYKQAIQLVPDIESKINDFNAPSGFESDQDSSSEEENETSDDCERSANLTLLTKKFKVLGVGGLCTPAYHSRQTHISVLPTELLVYIFRWVVSDHLDLRSLEQLSQVCKWFYACARDESLWRSACLRVFGKNCCPPDNVDECWRQMLLDVPHLNFHGVYINKVSYIRAGEQGLDGFYRPYHLVEYYRYLRFYTDGTVLVCTTADNPVTVIPTLRRKQHSAIISKGHFRVTAETVSITTKKIQKSQSESRNRRVRAAAPTPDQIFHLELQLQSSGRRRYNQLTWSSYSYKICHKSSGQQCSNQIDVQSFKPFHFSRVKSFHSTSNAPL